MIKYLTISVFLLLSCSQVYDRQQGPTYSEVIKPSIPVCDTPKYDIPSFSHFELKYDVLEFLLENPPLNLQHIYEIQCCDKWIAERVKGRMTFEEKQKEDK